VFAYAYASTRSFAKTHAADLRQQAELHALLSKMQEAFKPFEAGFGLGEFTSRDFSDIMHG
jgi:hypothetical protein